MKKINKSTFRTAVSIILAVIVSGMVVVATGILSNKISSISKLIESKRILTGVLSQREQTIRLLNLDFSKVGDYQSKFDAAVPMVYNLKPFIEFTESLGKKRGFDATTVLNPPTVLTSDPSGKATFSVGLTIQLAKTNADGLAAYLKDFEKSPYFAQIDSLRIVSVSKNGWEEETSATLVGKIYAKN